MMLGGEFECPYCKQKQERDIGRHEILTCKCGEQFHAYIRITTFTVPLSGGRVKDESSFITTGA